MNYRNESLIFFADPLQISEMSKNDIHLFKRNMQIIFASFVQFLTIVKNERKRNVQDWLQEKNEQGENAVIKLLTWVVWFQLGNFQEGISI